jgi:hypothetical protein
VAFVETHASDWSDALVFATLVLNPVVSFAGNISRVQEFYKANLR